ncbi:MAG: ribose 5-phosphate isomerase B [Erysipelotrichaceae bacterium]|nr:ribose 5-phosphate isomerase B [Erysipelotrichaceae bacterium]
MKIGITNDHAALNLKNELKGYLIDQGYEVIDYGTNTNESCDYPLMGNNLCDAMARNEVEKGIAICGTGVGISIACNKHKGIRAVCCSETSSARLSREHNDANVVCFGARIISFELAKDIVETFLNTPFSNGERHLKRIQELTDLDNQKQA